jgi:hypothetical protein
MSKIYSIDPNDGKYFLDVDRLYNPGISTFYQGAYKHTPIFPKYTIDATRFNYLTGKTTIKFYTMIPIKKLFNNYLVEVHHSYQIGMESNKLFDTVISNFNEFCEDMIKNIDIKKLIK